MNKTSALDQLFDPVANRWPPEVARQIIQQRPDPSVQRRIDDLAETANEGTLTSEEKLPYEEYEEGVDLIGILKPKARMVLARHAT
jgi:hypothetical protein